MALGEPSVGARRSGFGPQAVANIRITSAIVLKRKILTREKCPKQGQKRIENRPKNIYFSET